MKFVTTEKAERIAALVKRALMKRVRDFRDQGMSFQQIADEMGYSNDSSVRSLHENTRQIEQET